MVRNILCMILTLNLCLLPLMSLSDGSAEDTVTLSKDLYTMYRKFDKLLEIMEIVEEDYYEDVDEKALLEGAAAGLLSSLGDPYTYFYTADSFATYMEHQGGQYAGIGIQISTSYITRLSTISRVFAGSPAEAAGVHRGDILYQVEDLLVTPETINEAVSIMRGTPGTTVRVTFLRGEEQLDLVVGRAQITMNRVESCMLGDEIGYIRLWEFMGDCAQMFQTAMNDLMAEGMKGLILDLRDNPGGLLDDAVAIGDIFLDEGILTYIEYRDGTRQDYRTGKGRVDIPVAVIINENSVSCSELLTGALRDRLGTRVIGSTSYGKGVVQQLMRLNSEGEAMQLTIAQYYTPNGLAVHHVGIEPDVVISLPEGDNGMYQLGDMNDVQLRTAFEDMKATLDREGKD